MITRESSPADREFERLVDRLLAGEPCGRDPDPVGDLEAAAAVARALAPARVPVVGARARVWQRLAPSLDRAPTLGWRERWGGALVGRRRLAVTVAAAGLVVGLGLLSPLGQQAVGAAQESLTFTIFRVTPKGLVPLPEVATRRVGNTIIVMDEMLSVAEAERRAGFPITPPRDLPRGATLLGAQVTRHHADTPDEWRMVTLTYEVGDQVLTFTRARNGGRPLTPTAGGATATRVGADDLLATTPLDSAAGPAMTTTLVPLQRQATSVRVGAADGTLTTTRMPDGDPLSRTVAWQVGDSAYEVSGLLDAAVLLRIAASVPVGAAER
jgi:hypothetical protein